MSFRDTDFSPDEFFGSYILVDPDESRDERDHAKQIMEEEQIDPLIPPDWQGGISFFEVELARYWSDEHSQYVIMPKLHKDDPTEKVAVGWKYSPFNVKKLWK
jgi:hypothetical protein